MKKYRNLLLLIPFLVLFSCMEDESEYSSQEKENVQVDQVTVDTTDTDEELPEGQLVPGLHLVKLKVLQGQDSVERQFKYYMPVSPCCLSFTGVMNSKPAKKFPIPFPAYRKPMS